LFTDPEPHKKIMDDLHYKKKASNVCGSSMDLWVPVEYYPLECSHPMKKCPLISSFSDSDYYSSDSYFYYKAFIIGILYISLIFIII
jgi:hypothetical protein